MASCEKKKKKSEKPNRKMSLKLSPQVVRYLVHLWRLVLPEEDMVWCIGFLTQAEPSGKFSYHKLFP